MRIRTEVWGEDCRFEVVNERGALAAGRPSGSQGPSGTGTSCLTLARGAGTQVYIPISGSLDMRKSLAAGALKLIPDVHIKLVLHHHHWLFTLESPATVHAEKHINISDTGLGTSHQCRDLCGSHGVRMVPHSVGFTETTPTEESPLWVLDVSF